MWDIENTPWYDSRIGVIITRCVAVINLVYCLRGDRVTNNVMVWLAVGRVTVLRVCLLRFFGRTGGGGSVYEGCNGFLVGNMVGIHA